MPNSELQDVLATLKTYPNYTTYIEISPILYNFFKQKAQEISNFNIDTCPETLYGCPVFVNNELKNYEYRITRKENSNE